MKGVFPFQNNNIMKKIVLIISLSIISLGAFAQQDAMFTHYMFNTLAVNPAYAGSRDALTVTGLHRSQWIGFDGAPTTQTLTMHTPIPFKNAGIGLSFLNDKVGPTRMTSFYADFSYKIKITEKASLAFGLKGGVNLLKGDIANLQLTEAADPSFASNELSKLLPNFGFGLYYFTDTYYFGASIPKLMENDFSSNTVSAELGSEEKHYFFIAGSVFKLNDDFKLKPTTYVKITEAAPIEADITTSVIYQDKISVGAMFRTGDALGLLLGLHLTDVLEIGYSFDWSYNNTTFSYNQGSHEIVLRYDLIFRNEKKIYSPRYF